MNTLILAAKDSDTMSWPDAAVAIAFFLVLGFMFWTMMR